MPCHKTYLTERKLLTLIRRSHRRAPPCRALLRRISAEQIRGDPPLRPSTSRTYRHKTALRVLKPTIYWYTPPHPSPHREAKKDTDRCSSISRLMVFPSNPLHLPPRLPPAQPSRCRSIRALGLGRPAVKLLLASLGKCCLPACQTLPPPLAISRPNGTVHCWVSRFESRWIG